jgi:hypothetical protein
MRHGLLLAVDILSHPHLHDFRLLHVVDGSYRKSFAFYHNYITCLHGSARQVVIGHVAFKGEVSFFTIITNGLQRVVIE